MLQYQFSHNKTRFFHKATRANSANCSKCEHQKQNSTQTLTFRLDTPFNMYSIRTKSHLEISFSFSFNFDLFNMNLLLFSVSILDNNINRLSYLSTSEKWLSLFPKWVTFFVWIVGTCSKHLLSIQPWGNTKYTTWTLLLLEV
jgi:hypothetical protein